MFLKIVSGPGRTYILTNVQTISFTSHVSSNIMYNKTTSQFSLETKDGVLAPLDADYYKYENFIDDEELSTMSPYGNSDDTYYVQTATVKYLDGKTTEVRNFAFTGVAYFCDDSGKTLDVLR